MGSEADHAERVATVADQGHQIVDPALGVGMSHAQLHSA